MISLLLPGVQIGSPLQQVLDVPEGEMADHIRLPPPGITMS